MRSVGCLDDENWMFCGFSMKRLEICFGLLIEGTTKVFVIFQERGFDRFGNRFNEYLRSPTSEY